MIIYSGYLLVCMNINMCIRCAHLTTKFILSYIYAGVSSFNIVNKSNKDDIIQSVKDIEDAFQKDEQYENKLSICAHYSMKYNKSRKMDGA